MRSSQRPSRQKLRVTPTTACGVSIVDRSWAVARLPLLRRGCWASHRCHARCAALVEAQTERAHAAKRACDPWTGGGGGAHGAPRATTMEATRSCGSPCTARTRRLLSCLSRPARATRCVGARSGAASSAGSRSASASAASTLRCVGRRRRASRMLVEGEIAARGLRTGCALRRHRFWVSRTGYALHRRYKKERDRLSCFCFRERRRQSVTPATTAAAAAHFAFRGAAARVECVVGRPAPR